MSEGWQCGTCGEEHQGVPLSFACDFPDLYANLTSDDRETRAIIGSDQCVLDEKGFFLRGLLEIPLKDADGVFLWGLWASVTEQNYDEIDGLWTEEGRENLDVSFAARLANDLPGYYPGTLNLKVRIHLRPVGQRPVFIVEEDHKLERLQREGITLHEAAEIAHRLMSDQENIPTHLEQ
jgi:hypothetical protein